MKGSCEVRCTGFGMRVLAEPGHHRYARFIDVIKSCSTVAIETQTK